MCDMTTTCFSCRTEPAGFPENPFSAYCPACQPVSERQLGSVCPACHRVFGGTWGFDLHQRPGVPDSCMDPATKGLVQDSAGVWRNQISEKGLASLRGGAQTAPGPSQVSG